MHAMRAGRGLLACWVCVAVGCSSKPPEEKTVASSASALVTVGWEGTGAMGEARKFHAGVVLPSGKVLVVGGYNSSGFLSSATVYEPGTGTWTAVSPMPQARQTHTATVLSTGKVLVAGGENATGRLSSAVVYDPATNTWASAGSFASGVARDWMTATLLPLSGKVLVAGGGNAAGAHSKVEVFDPATGTWAAGPSMRTPRRSHTATVLANGKVLVVGGSSGGATGEAEVYDPETNWSATGALATARYDHTATLLPSGKVLVVGGRNGTNGAVLVGTAEEYDPSTGQWSAAGALGNARAQHTATLLSTGKVLVAGGLYGSAPTNALASAEVYDPGTGQWSAVTALGSARYLHVALALETQGKVLVVGGVGASGSSQKTAELYVYDACAGVSCNSAPGTCYEAAGTCNNGVCSYTPKAVGASCDDGDACTGADACNGAGVCAGSPTSCSNPPGQCYEAAGTCSGGACDYAYKAAGAGCDDGDACTVGEECNGAGGCAGTPVSCTTPPGQCYEAAGTCSGGACTYALKAAGTACDDGNGGTTNDVCSGAGVCAGALACSTPPDACHGSPGTYANGVCTYPLLGAGTPCGAGQICTGTGTCESKCWIGGTMHEAQAINPSGACQECNPSLSTTSWSFRPSTAQCRGSAGVCDVAEYCTGSSSSCPGDAFVSAGTQCRTSGGLCDVTESCTGTGAACPTDAVAGAGTSCRAAGGICDVAEVCNGSAKTCPGDGYAANGTSCGTSAGGWGSCGGFSDYCDTTGTQTRTVTASTCGTGTCSATSTSTETQACTRAAPNTSCGSSSYGGWSACSFSDVCSETGTRSRRVTDYDFNCATGQCEASSYTETQNCSRSTEGNSCDSFTAWSQCFGTGTGDYCSTEGFQYQSRADLTCQAQECRVSQVTTIGTRSCPLQPPNTTCTTPPSYGAWSACSFSDACTTTGTRSRTVTSYVFSCAAGFCQASTSTETQACTAAPSPPYAVCNGQCVDTSNDFFNCGACGHRCPNPAFHCEAGDCVLCSPDSVDC